MLFVHNREYEESQRRAYADLQSKARRDKTAMMSLVLATEQSRISSGSSGAEGVLKTQDKCAGEITRYVLSSLPECLQANTKCAFTYDY